MQGEGEEAGQEAVPKENHADAAQERSGDVPWLPNPVTLAAIRARKEVGAFDRLDPRRALQLGEMVRMTAGAFEDMVGRLVELRDQDRVVVLLELLGRAVPAQLSRTRPITRAAESVAE